MEAKKLIIETNSLVDTPGLMEAKALLELDATGATYQTINPGEEKFTYVTQLGMSVVAESIPDVVKYEESMSGPINAGADMTLRLIFIPKTKLPARAFWWEVERAMLKLSTAQRWRIDWGGLSFCMYDLNQNKKSPCKVRPADTLCHGHRNFQSISQMRHSWASVGLTNPSPDLTTYSITRPINLKPESHSSTIITSALGTIYGIMQASEKQSLPPVPKLTAAKVPVQYDLPMWPKLVNEMLGSSEFHLLFYSSAGVYKIDCSICSSKLDNILHSGWHMVGHS